MFDLEVELKSHNALPSKLNAFPLQGSSCLDCNPYSQLIEYWLETAH